MWDWAGRLPCNVCCEVNEACWFIDSKEGDEVFLTMKGVDV